MTRLLLTLLLLINFSFLNAQVYRNLTTANGLRNNNIYSIARDKEGFLWFLSSNGVDRFDGLDFIHFNLNTANRPSGLKPVSHLVSDNSGDIWLVGSIASDSIARFDRSSGQFAYVPIVGAAREGGLRHLFIDRDNRIWIANSRKVFIYDINGGRQIDVGLHFTSDIVCGVQLDNGKYVLGMKKGMVLVSEDGGRWSFRHLNSRISIIEHKDEIHDMQAVIPANLGELSTHKIVACHDGQSDILVFDSQSRIYRVDIDDDFAKVCIIKKIYDTHITDIKPFFDDANKLLIATEGRGVIAYDINKCKAEEYLQCHFDGKQGLKGNVVMNILPDPSKKRVWFANYPYGVLCYNLHFPTYRHFSHERGNPNTVSAGVVTAITEDSDGDVWFATSSGVSCYLKQTGKWKHYLADENRRNLTYLAACEIRPGQVLATGLMSGAFVIDKQTDAVEYITPQKLGSDEQAERAVRSVYADDRGIIWIAGEEKLVRLDWNSKTFSSSPLASQALVIKRRDKDNFWLVTLDGLYSVDALSGKKTKFILPETCIDVNDVLTASNGDLYIATVDEGLFVKKFSKGEKDFRQYVFENSGLLSNNILALVEDDSCNILMSSDQGLMRYYPEKDAFISWAHWQGMVSHGFYKKSAAHLSDGRTLFGTNNGFMELGDSVRMPRVLKSRIILSNLHINGEPRNVSSDFSELDLSYGERQVGFTVGSLNFDNPQLIVYSWKLSSTSDNWTMPSKNRRINYLLAPGNYQLSIRAINGADHSVIEERIVDISVGQPWWFSLPAILVYIALAVLLVYGVYFFFKYRNKRLMAEDKVKFFIQTAHDLRTPLTLIKAPLEEISRNEKLSARGEQNVQTALKSANDLIIFASDLLNLERQKIKETCLHLSSINLNIYLQELIIPFQLYARTKHLDLIFSSATNGKVWVDRSRMDSIMYNIINNALKYTQPKGSVVISANMSDQDWTVTVSDTGIGIPEDELPKMTEMFYRSKNVEGTRIEGTGMGLNLVKQLVDEHYGSMALSSEEGKGTTFTLTFPIDYEKRKNIKKITGDALDGKKTLDSPRVLVVEDSIDLREFMVRSLSESYYVYVAENGQEAYSKIRFLNPDIVVSDVMMPYMRGDELCRKIKSEVETSHIPIILLTALADSDSVIDGLSTLADAYLTKPFSVDLLKAQIDNILSNRKSLQKLYSRIAIAPKGTSEAMNVANSAEVIGQANMSEVDVDFIKSVSAIVDAHIRDAEFNVDILCTSIGMSRTSFYNKLKSLTGYPPADFVRLRRVEKSKYLLLNSELSIQEISERCGFVDVKYFREVFRKNVKCSPRDFRKGNVPDSGLKEEADASASS